MAHNTDILTFTLQVGDIEGDVHLAKRLRRSSSDALQDMVNGDELSLYGSGPNSAQSAQVDHYSEETAGLNYFLSLPYIV